MSGIFVLFPILNRTKLLPYFLKYYSSLGAQQFVCGLYGGRENKLYNEIVSIGESYRIEVRAVTDATITECNPEKETKGLNLIRQEFADRFDWYCIADLDEYYYFQGLDFPQVMMEADRRDCQAAHGRFFDRIAIDGSFPEIGDSLDQTFPLACNLTECIGACCDKIVLAKSHLSIGVGHHRTEGKVWLNAAEVHHFKWSKGVDDRLESHFHGYRKQGYTWAKKEIPLALKRIRDGLNLNDPELKVRPATKLGV